MRQKLKIFIISRKKFFLHLLFSWKKFWIQNSRKKKKLPLKGLVYLGEHHCALGTPKRSGFNNKNRIHLSIWRVVKDMKRHLHKLFSVEKFIFWVCLFPRILKSQKWASKNENLGKITNFAKINKINVGFCDKSCDCSVVRP